MHVETAWMGQGNELLNSVMQQRWSGEGDDYVGRIRHGREVAASVRKEEDKDAVKVLADVVTTSVEEIDEAAEEALSADPDRSGEAETGKGDTVTISPAAKAAAAVTPENGDVKSSSPSMRDMTEDVAAAVEKKRAEEDAGSQTAAPKVSLRI